MPKAAKRRRPSFPSPGPVGPPGRFSHGLWLGPVGMAFLGGTLFTGLMYPTLVTAFSFPEEPVTRTAVALGGGGVFALLTFAYLFLWWMSYVSAVLPLAPHQSKREVLHLAWLYMRGNHGAAYQVMNGKKVETFTPHHRRGWQVVLLDSASAAVMHYMGQYDVLGPGVHFLSPRHSLVAFFDLREHRSLLKGNAKNSPTRGRTADGIPIAADLVVVCYLDDFHPDPRWQQEHRGPQGQKPPRSMEQAVEHLWLQVYREPAKVLRRRASFATPFFGHRASILKAFENLDPETVEKESTCAWWRVAEHTAAELWLKLVERYTLTELFPPGWEIAQDPDAPTGFERLQRAFQERLTQPYYWDDFQQRWQESPEFAHLLARGVRVRAAAISMVHLEDETLTEHNYHDPLPGILKARAEAIKNLSSQLEHKARVEIASQWMCRLHQTIQQNPELYALVQAFTEARDGQSPGGRAGSVDLSQTLSRSHLLALLDACLEAWYPLMNTPEQNRSEEFRALQTLRHRLRLEKERG